MGIVEVNCGIWRVYERMLGETKFVGVGDMALVAAMTQPANHKTCHRNQLFLQAVQTFLLEHLVF